MLSRQDQPRCAVGLRFTYWCCLTSLRMQRIVKQQRAVKSSSTSFLGAADVQRARQSSGARLSVPLLSQYVPCGPSVDAVMQIASYKAILVQCSVMRSPLCFVRPLVHAAACVRQNSLMWNDSPCLMSTVWTIRLETVLQMASLLPLGWRSDFSPCQHGGG